MGIQKYFYEYISLGLIFLVSDVDSSVIQCEMKKY